MEIITGKLDETEHTRVIEQVSDFLMALQGRDPNETGILSTDAIELTAKKTFKLKSAEQLAEIRSLCDEEEVQ